MLRQPFAHHADQASLSPSSQSLLSISFPTKIWQSWKEGSQDPIERTIPTVTSSDLFTSMKDQIVKADFLRYLILLREGGVWADIDVYPRQPLSKWIPEKFLDSINMVIGIENDHHKKPI
ncbi:initiation-specific alpha-mannosyltransferase [Colletotrichum graminicola]|nr:initiation-specific alpha-mannosyltransferase [Colletotrichum graminicola]